MAILARFAALWMRVTRQSDRFQAAGRAEL